MSWNSRSAFHSHGLAAAALFFLAIAGSGPTQAMADPGDASPDGMWTELELSSMPATQRADDADAFRVYTLNPQALETTMAMAPMENSLAARGTEIILTIPMPDGSYEKFRIEESPVMEPELAATLPGVHTFLGRGIDNPALTTRFDRTPLGFHAVVLSPGGTIFVEPVELGDTVRYRSYRASGIKAAAFECQVKEFELATPAPIDLTAPSGDNLRTYRLAVAATGEYTQFFGDAGTALANIVTTVNAVNAPYGIEVAVRLILVANNNLIVYTDPTTDPFPLSDKNSEVQAAIDSAIGDANYDIGHLFHVEGTDISGNAGCIGCICTSGSKGSGWSQGPTPTNSDYLFVVCHEMGHQVGGTHTFNGTGCSASQYTASSAWEPGSGTTIMSYSSVCGSDNVIGGLAGDLYFHAGSRALILNNLAVAGCGTSAPTGNGIPSVDAGSDFTIPRGTPFSLTASASDPDNDPLTYCWEQFDLGPTASITAVDDGAIPLFRSFPPAASITRTFPRYSDLLAGNLFPGTLGEQLPSTDRVMTFRVTARDNVAGAGAADDDEMVVTVLGSPFSVTYPNGGESLVGGCPTTVTWNVGGGDVATHVNILFSTDGGGSFPVTLAANTLNDGTESVLIPCGGTSQGRVRIEAVGNIFFDISNGEFDVTAEGPEATCSINGGEVDEDCEFLVTFSGTVTDDCSVDAGDVTVTLSLPSGGATLGTPTINIVQTDESTVEVTGSVLVSNLLGPPVTVRIRIDAVDGCGDSDFCSSDAVVADTTPPTIDVALNRYALWPPNHKLSEITATVTATDNCDPMVAFVLTSITSNEPDNGLGDGDTANDIQGASLDTPDLAFFLRSERSGAGTGRKYTIVYTAEDNAGNTATDTVCVRVPHDRSGMAAEVFNPDERAYGPLTDRFGLIIYGTSLVDVEAIDREEASLGNHVGALRPIHTWSDDIDGDGRMDLMLAYDEKQTGRLIKTSTGTYPVGFHYSVSGLDYWVESILDLGLTLRGISSEDVGPGEGEITPEDDSAVEPGDRGLAATDQDLLTLPAGGYVRIEVFNVQGRKVMTLVDRVMGPGSLQLDWNGRDEQGQAVASGVYFYRIDAPGVTEVRKIRIIR